MKIVTTMGLVLCLVLSRALCFAHGETRTGIEKDGQEVPIALTQNTGMSGLDKSYTITAVLEGHVLSVVFCESLGQVSVEVTTATGNMVEFQTVFTPNGLHVYIPGTGDYVVTFTLLNGDVYFGEFSVTD